MPKQPPKKRMDPKGRRGRKHSRPPATRVPGTSIELKTKAAEVYDKAADLEFRTRKTHETAHQVHQELEALHSNIDPGRSSASAAEKSSAETKRAVRAAPTVAPNKLEQVPPRTASPKKPFPIVVLGASAGGFEAISEVLKNIPPQTGMAFVVIQHLDPSAESKLSDLLSRVAKIPVVQIEQSMHLSPDRVHVIPPDRDLSVEGRVLRLGPRRKTDGSHMPIDSFFRSLAQEHTNRAIGVVLSGNGADGSLGSKALKAEGGITLAQDPRTAKFPGMPASAIQSGYVDFVLPPARIATELVRLSQHPALRTSQVARAAGPIPTDEDYNRILGLLQAHSGVNFYGYKHSTLKRRVGRRMVLNKAESFAEYLHQLEQNPAELDALYNDILINVTEFFRDAAVFKTLKRRVFPNILKQRSREAAIRIWVPGCATGEEAYSLAIAAHEFLGKDAQAINIQVFATDISDAALAKARAGLYPAGIASSISPERLRRYFQETDRGYQIVRFIRDMCVFARQNVAEDPPFSKLDLISCRNVLIYLGSLLQKKVMPIFHYALNPHGFLLLGASETIGAYAEMFTLVDKKSKIYVRKITSSRHDAAFFRKALPELAPSSRTSLAPHESAPIELKKHVDQILLTRYAPAGVVVNSNLEVLHFRGQTGPYLEHPAGEANLSLLKLVREGLVVDLRTALARALKADVPVRKEGVSFRSNGQIRQVTIEVIPFRDSHSRERFCLILFTQPSIVEDRLEKTARKKGKLSENVAAQREMQHLREEIQQTKESLQAIIEEQEATNEELTSANEEIQSSNEELQSTNEELETAKEELQSTNEELTTLNEELHTRNGELAQVNNDLNNLIGSFNLPMLMLGNDLTIRRFTPMAEKTFNLIASDLGRPISDINPNFNLPNLAHLAKEVIDSLNMREVEVQDRTGRWFSLRVRPYRTNENRIDGAVLVLIDIDEIKQGLTEITSMIRQPILMLSGDFRILEANQAFFDLFRTTREEVQNRRIFDIPGGNWKLPALHTMLEDALPENNCVENFQVEHDFGKAGRRTIQFNARRLHQSGKGTRLIVLILDDLTPRKDSHETPA